MNLQLALVVQYEMHHFEKFTFRNYLNSEWPLTLRVTQGHCN